MGTNCVMVGGPADGRVINDVDLSFSGGRPGAATINIPILIHGQERMGWETRVVPDEEWENMERVEAMNPITGEWENHDLVFRRHEYKDTGETDGDGRRVFLYVPTSIVQKEG